jgi:CRISPR/Cas system-associated protein Cas5 (RAMP superfamily)
MFTETETLTPAEETQSDKARESSTLRVITWFSVGMAVAALGILLGHELRSRYKFKRRTPYDYYSNAGERQAGEFGVGV